MNVRMRVKNALLEACRRKCIDRVLAVRYWRFESRKSSKVSWKRSVSRSWYRQRGGVRKNRWFGKAVKECTDQGVENGKKTERLKEKSGVDE